MQDKVHDHFERMAERYDAYKKKNAYYYEAVKNMYGELIRESDKKSILEIGCGTGDIIASLRPKLGMGIDLSQRMIELAKKKHPEIGFRAASAEDVKVDEKFDYIIMADVIEHLADVEKTIENIRKIAAKSTIIITMANPIWEPVLMLAEKLGLKMPEGPHKRITKKELTGILARNSLKVTMTGKRLLVPKKIPFVHRINEVFYRIPFLERFGLIEYMVIKNEKG